MLTVQEDLNGEVLAGPSTIVSSAPVSPASNIAPFISPIVTKCFTVNTTLQIETPSPNQDNPSPGPSCSKYYSVHEESPFKSYCKIRDDSGIIANPLTKHRNVLPPAVSGSEYTKYIETKLNKKKEEEDNKKKRKEERERKKLDKEANKTKGSKVAKKLFTETNSSPDESSSENEMILDDEEECNEIILNINECQACGSETNKENSSAWMGCNYCSRWYHKACFEGEYENMTDHEIEMLDFKCDICLKIERSKKKMNVSRK